MGIAIGSSAPICYNGCRPYLCSSESCHCKNFPLAARLLTNAAPSPSKFPTSTSSLADLENGKSNQMPLCKSLKKSFLLARVNPKATFSSICFPSFLIAGLFKRSVEDLQGGFVVRFFLPSLLSSVSTVFAKLSNRLRLQFLSPHGRPKTN